MDQALLKKYVTYFPETGEFIRNKSSGGVVSGSKCGSVNANGYVQFRVLGKMLYAHRLAFLYMEGFLPKEVDHINHDRTDNRWENLRASSGAENSKNRSLSKNNKSGVNGVSWCTEAKKWRAKLRRNGIDINIGYFESLNEAENKICCEKYNLGFHENHGKTLIGKPSRTV